MGGYKRIAAISLTLTLLAGCSGGSSKNSMTNTSSSSSKTEAGPEAVQFQASNGIGTDPSDEKIKSRDIKLAKKSEKARYLKTNAIELQQYERNIKTSRGEVKLRIFQVSGLADKTLERRLNTSMENDLVTAIKDYTAEKNETPVEMYCQVGLNVNNLLSIYIVNLYSPPLYGFIYSLTDGKRLELKDIFTSGTDYVSLLNRKVIEAIAGEGNEEYWLREPFSSIKPNQSFSLSESGLSMIFHAGESGFSTLHTVTIPLWRIDDYVDVIDRHSEIQSEKYKKPEMLIYKNNIFVKHTGDVIKRNNGNVLTYYPEISGLEDPDFQQDINSKIKEGINEVLKSSKLDALQRNPKEPNSPIANIEMDVMFNHYGLLCIYRYIYGSDYNELLNTFQDVYSFDLKSKKSIDCRSLLETYMSKNRGVDNLLSSLVKERLKQFYTDSGQYKDFVENVDSKINYSFIKNNSTIYFRSYGDSNDIYVYIRFKENTFTAVPSSMECDIPLKKITNSTYEDFFGL